MCDERGMCLFVVSGGVFFVCFFLGCCLVGGVGECRGFLLVFLEDVLMGFFSGVLWCVLM